MNEISQIAPVQFDTPVVPLVDVFVSDRDSEGVVRQCLAGAGFAARFTNGTIEDAIGELARGGSPRLLIVDVSGVDDPTARVRQLADVCDPSTGVIVIGETNDIRFYRDLRDSGVVEYFFKPLVASLVARSCNEVLSGVAEHRGARLGKLVTVMSVRGGSGATTIAAALAWHLAETLQRRTMLLDLDLHFGDLALLVDAVPTHALIEALAQPDRVDDLFLHRGVIQVTQRLGMLASLEPCDDPTLPDEAAVLPLLDKLLARFRYVLIDLPAPLAARLPRVLHLPGTCLLVSDASLAAARDVGRWRQIIGADTPDRTTLHILNKSGAFGSLSQEDFTRAAGQAPDIVVPFDREAGRAASLGIQTVSDTAALQKGLAPVLRVLTGEQEAAPASLLARIFGR
ncbi:MAG: cellulose synthase operon protein YhjQ/BcsQ [Acetobacteraceae bacterium]